MYDQTVRDRVLLYMLLSTKMIITGLFFQRGFFHLENLSKLDWQKAIY